MSVTKWKHTEKALTKCGMMMKHLNEKRVTGHWHAHAMHVLSVLWEQMIHVS